MLKRIFISISLALPLLCFSQSPEKMIEDFFQDYESLSPSETLENLYSGMAYKERIQNEIDQLKIKFKNLTNIVGAYKGYDLIGKRDVVNRYQVYTYLVRYSRQPIRFTFKFYKPEGKWNLHGFSYDDDLTAEVQESLKMHHLLNEGDQ